MYALTLHQPYATLIARFAKRVETRAWCAPSWIIDERIAIHAGKNTDHLALAELFPFCAHLPEAETLPMGAVVCTAILDRCSPITRDGAARLEQKNPTEHAFGNYNLDDGPRWAWILRDVEVFAEPIYCRGYQKLWTWEDQPQGRLI